MKKLYFLLLFFVITLFSFSQNYCAGDHFVDSGGLNNNYSDNENITTVITPDPGQTIQVVFNAFDLEAGYDFLSIYNGVDVNAPLLGTFSGAEIPGPFVANNATGSLTFVFTSDYSVTKPGWDAVVQCQAVGSTCIEPSDLIRSNITENSFDLDWTTNGSETSWEIQYGISGFPLGSGAIIQTNSKPYSFTGLTDRFIDVYIRANCGTDTSFWAGPYSVILSCPSTNAPFVESFQENTIPDCWEMYGSEDWQFSTNAAYDAENANDHTIGGNTNYAWIDGSNPNGSGEISNLFTPWIDISSLATPTVYFSVFSLNTFEGTYNTLDVILHEQSGGNHSLLHLQGTTTNWYNYLFDLTTVTTESVVRLEFIIEENSPQNAWHNDILIDDVMIDNLISCLNPNNFTSSNITQTSADIAWSAGDTETAWELEYGISGFLLGQGTSVFANATSGTITNLNSGTTYDIYLRADCGNNDYSIWIGPYQFTTLPNYCNGDHFYDSGNLNGNYQNNENNTTTIYPEGADAVVVTFLNFDLETNYDFLSVYDGPDNTFPLLGTFTGTTIPGPFTATDNSGSLTFVFTSDNTQNRSGWDATVVCETYTCPKPTNLTASNVTATSVDLSWTNGGTENTWEIEYGPSGFMQGTGTTVLANSNPFTLTGILSGRRQDIYLRAICGANIGDDDSFWTDSIRISTPCDIFIAPFEENFDYTDTPGCWFESGDENWKYGTDATFNASSAGDFTSSGNTNYAYIDGSEPTGSGHISNLFTPTIDISTLAHPTVSFAIFSENSNDNTFNTIDVILHDGANTSNLFHLQGSSSGWQVPILDISNLVTSNLIQLEFIVEENSTGNAFYNDILIDDIKVYNDATASTNNYALNNLKIFPNPVLNVLRVNSLSNISKITIYDILGKEVLKQANMQQTNLEINTKNLIKGIYFIKITLQNNDSKTYKIVKK